MIELTLDREVLHYDDKLYIQTDENELAFIRAYLESIDKKAKEDVNDCVRFKYCPYCGEKL